jgi:hypothetical protein
LTLSLIIQAGRITGCRRDSFAESGIFTWIFLPGDTLIAKLLGYSPAKERNYRLNAFNIVFLRL